MNQRTHRRHRLALMAFYRLPLRERPPRRMERHQILAAAPRWAQPTLRLLRPDTINVTDYGQRVHAVKDGHHYILRSARALSAHRNPGNDLPALVAAGVIKPIPELATCLRAHA